MANSLSNRTLLVNLSISQWTARKLDKKETKHVEDRHGVHNVASVYKSILGSAETSLDAIHKKSTEIRTFYLSKTLPWGLNGMNIIAANEYIDFMRTIKGMMDDWKDLVTQFLRDYPGLVAKAELTLGSIFNPNDYPTVADLERKFAIDVKVFPVPDTSDIRVELADDHLKAVLDEVRRSERQAVEQAMLSAWERVRAVVSNARERLANPTAVFRDTLVENAKDLVDAMGTLNLTGDPTMRQVADELKTSLCAYNPDTLRRDPLVRSDVAAKMAELDGVMDSYFGRTA